MPIWAVIGTVIAGIALIAIVVTFIWGEKTTPGDGFYSEMKEAEKQGL